MIRGKLARNMSSEIHYTENSKLHPSAKEHQLARNFSNKVPPHSTAKNDLENKNDPKMVTPTHHNFDPWFSTWPNIWGYIYQQTRHS